MALVQKKISKAKQLKLAAVLILVIGITLSVAYFGLLRAPTFSDEPAGSPQGVSRALLPRIPTQTGYEAARKLGEIELFSALRKYGIWPLPLAPAGRREPFILRAQEEEE